jgi:hypothetical protein
VRSISTALRCEPMRIRGAAGRAAAPSSAGAGLDAGAEDVWASVGIDDAAEPCDGSSGTIVMERSNLDLDALAKATVSVGGPAA